jgi:hypothetical protein
MSTPLRFTFGSDSLKQREDHNLGDSDNNSNAAIGAAVVEKNNNMSSNVRTTLIHQHYSTVSHLELHFSQSFPPFFTT